MTRRLIAIGSLLLLVGSFCSTGQQQVCEDGLCTEAGDWAQLGSLLQKAFTRAETESLDVAETSDSEDVRCIWEPQIACQTSFMYKGTVYNGCCHIDHPTPWCSHDQVHSGDWSVCARDCIVTDHKTSQHLEVDYAMGYGGRTTMARHVIDESESLSSEKCTAPLVRFAAMNDINAVKPIKEGHDPFFPAAESSIAPPGASCGDSAQNVLETCRKYDHWETMDSISEARGFSFAVFDPATHVPSYTDVQQGELGTCYFLAALASIAYRAPEVIEDMFVWREYWDQGVISTKWLINGMESVVEVDKTVPASRGRPYFTQLSNSGAWWPAALEKAWSKIYSSYKAAEAGFWAVAASAITRAPTVTYYHSKVKGEDLWQVLLTASKHKWPMGAGTQQAHYGLAAGHAYSVLEAWHDRDRGRLVKMRNPWHTNYYKGSQANPNYGDNSGIFTMSFDEFEIAFHSNSIAKVAPSYKVSSARVTQVSGDIKGAFSFNIQSAKWFSVSIVWPNHRMLCKMPEPWHLLAVRKYGESTVFTPEPVAYAGNAVYIEVPAGAGGGPGTYTVVLSATFPIDTFIHEVYLNVYAEQSVDIVTPQVDYSTLVLGMVGPAIKGAPCDIVMTESGGLWRANKAKLVYGVPTYDSWDGSSFAYYVSDEDQWFLIQNDKLPAVSEGHHWSHARLSKGDFLCGCRDSDSGVGGMSGVGCDVVKAPSVKYSNVRCDATVEYTVLAQAYCPLTCDVDVCKMPLPYGLDLAPLLPSLSDTPSLVCEDTPNFIDEHGLPCAAWQDYDCSRAAEQWLYTQSGEKAVLRNCQATCPECRARQAAAKSQLLERARTT